MNRVDAAHLGRTIRCGGCSNTLKAVTRVMSLDTEGLEQLTVVAPVPVLVDFWASWCGPCRTFAPQLDAFAEQQQGRVIVTKVDVDENPLAVQKYKVQSVPTLGLWYEGALRYLQPGILTTSQLNTLVAPWRRYVV